MDNRLKRARELLAEVCPACGGAKGRPPKVTVCGGRELDHEDVALLKAGMVRPRRSERIETERCPVCGMDRTRVVAQIKLVAGGF